MIKIINRVYVNKKNKKAYQVIYEAKCCDNNCSCENDIVIVYEDLIFSDKFTRHKNEFLEKFEICKQIT